MAAYRLRSFSESESWNIRIESSTKRNPRLIDAEKLENPLVFANNRGTSHAPTVRHQEVFE